MFLFGAPDLAQALAETGRESFTSLAATPVTESLWSIDALQGPSKPSYTPGCHASKQGLRANLVKFSGRVVAYICIYIARSGVLKLVGG